MHLLYIALEADALALQYHKLWIIGLLNCFEIYAYFVVNFQNIYDVPAVVFVMSTAECLNCSVYNEHIIIIVLFFYSTNSHMADRCAVHKCITKCKLLKLI